MNELFGVSRLRFFGVSRSLSDAAVRALVDDAGVECSFAKVAATLLVTGEVDVMVVLGSVMTMGSLSMKISSVEVCVLCVLFGCKTT